MNRKFFGFLMLLQVFLVSAAPVRAQSFTESTTFGRENWTVPEMAAEVKRYKFHGIRTKTQTEAVPRKVAVLSGFLETGQDWPDLETTDDPGLAAIVARREQIVEFLSTMSSVELSLLADSVEIVRAERIGDWACVTGIGCYPKGYVIAAVGLSADNAAALCNLFHANQWFCAAAEDK